MSADRSSRRTSSRSSLLPADERRTITMPLEAGRYRVRTTDARRRRAALGQRRRIGDRRLCARSPKRMARRRARRLDHAALQFENGTTAEQLFILERMAWTDQAATAAEVTALQLFRDLFASEALRPGEECSVGSVAIVFTDLRSSTQLYREIGDAVAFGHVLSHFDVVKACIADEGGAVVKTIGDAVMAVFTRPVCALRAMTRAQARLAAPPTGSRRCR